MAFRVVTIFRITAGDLRFLPSGCEAFVEGFERRIEAASSQGRHVEHSPDRCAPES
jgi:hypothetical protein